MIPSLGSRAAGRLKLGDKGGVLGRGDSSLKHGQDLNEVPTNQGARVEPKTGKDLAFIIGGVGQGQRLKAPFAEREPVDGRVPDAPDKVFADAIALVSLEFIVEVVAGTAVC